MSSHKFVFDASAIMAMLIPNDAARPIARHLTDVIADRTHICWSTSLLPYEVANGLRSAVKRQRLTVEQAEEVLSTFEVLPLKLVSVPLQRVLELATEWQLSVYDASYAWLAMSKHAELVTLDKDLLALDGTF